MFHPSDIVEVAAADLLDDPVELGPERWAERGEKAAYEHLRTRDAGATDSQ